MNKHYNKIRSTTTSVISYSRMNSLFKNDFNYEAESVKYTDLKREAEQCELNFHQTTLDVVDEIYDYLVEIEEECEINPLTIKFDDFSVGAIAVIYTKKHFVLTKQSVGFKDVPVTDIWIAQDTKRKLRARSAVRASSSKKTTKAISPIVEEIPTSSDEFESASLLEKYAMECGFETEYNDAMNENLAS